MRKLVLYLICVVGFGQEANMHKTYYPAINKAELAIMDQDFVNAVQHFDTAFFETKKYFLKDAYNAALASALSGNGDMVYTYLRKCAAKGLSLDFVKDDFVFSSIQKDTLWRAFEIEYLESKRSFDKKINTKLRDELLEMAFWDAKYRKGNLILHTDSVKIVDAENAIRLEKIIETYGMPDEDLIGVGEGGFPEIQMPYYAIIRHQSGEGQTVNFSNQLLEAVSKGRMLPHIGASLLGMSSGNDTFFSRHVFKITSDNQELFSRTYALKLNQWVYREQTAEEELPFDELRLKNGMETLVDYRRKINFSLNNNRFLFPHRVFASIWVVDNPDTAEQFFEGTTILNP